MATVETHAEQHPPAESAYDGFISYSHSADELLAPRLQAGLQRFAKPWWKRRALRIFRDEASLAANPHLWGSIVEAMEGSDWFVLLMSPEAAQSDWVNREVEWWLEHKDPSRIIPVVTDGEFGWADRDVAGDAMPPALRGVFTDEPRWVDLRFARTEEQLHLKNPQFSAAVADIASAMRGIPKDELESEEVRQHRRTVRTAWAGALVVLALAILAGAAAIYANGQRITAEANEAEARAQREIADQQRAVAEQLAREARADALAATSIAQLDFDPELSLLLALESLALDGQIDGFNAIQQALQAHRALFDVPAPPTAVIRGSGATGGISPDGDRLVVAGHGSFIEAWEVGGENPLWTWETPFESSVVISPRFTADGASVLAVVTPSLAYNPIGMSDENADAVVGEETLDRLFVIDAVSGETRRSIDIPACPWLLGTVPMPPHVDLALPIPWAACGEQADVVVGLLDVDDGSFAPVASFPISLGVGLPTIDGEAALFAAGLSGTGQVIELATNEAVFEFESGVSTLSPDGRTILTIDGLWDLETGMLLWELDEYPARGWFSDDGQLAYVAGPAGGGLVLDSRTGEVLLELVGHEGELWELGMATDGRRQASFSRAGSARVWDLSTLLSHAARYPTSAERRQHPSGGVSLGGGVAAVWIGEPQRVGQPWKISVFDLASGETVRTVEGGAPALSPDGSWLAYRTMHQDDDQVRVGAIHIVEVASGDLVREISLGCTQELVPGDANPSAGCALQNGLALWRLQFSPDGTALGVVDGFDLSSVWEISTGELVFRQPFPSGVPSAIAFTPDQEYVVLTDAFDRLRVYDLDSAALVGSVFSEGAGAFLDAIFAADGSALYAATNGGEILVIDPTTWTGIDTITAGRGSILDLAVNPAGTRLASAGGDGVVNVWNAADRSITSTIAFDVDEISNVEFIDESHLLVTPGLGKEAIVITLDPSELVEVARSRLFRSFTPEECARYDIDPCPTLDEIKGG